MWIKLNTCWLNMAHIVTVKVDDDYDRLILSEGNKGHDHCFKGQDRETILTWLASHAYPAQGGMICNPLVAIIGESPRVEAVSKRWVSASLLPQEKA